MYVKTMMKIYFYIIIISGLVLRNASWTIPPKFTNIHYPL